MHFKLKPKHLIKDNLKLRMDGFIIFNARFNVSFCCIHCMFAVGILFVMSYSSNHLRNIGFWLTSFILCPFLCSRNLNKLSPSLIPYLFYNDIFKFNIKIYLKLFGYAIIYVCCMYVHAIINKPSVPNKLLREPYENNNSMQSTIIFLSNNC